MTNDGVTIQSGIAYANHDGVELLGDLYLPEGAKSAPALVAVHGGGWVQGARNAFQYWGPYLAARGIAVFAISYRLAAKEKMFPQAVQDVLAGVQFRPRQGWPPSASIRRASVCIGASAGGHLAALAALGGKKFAGGYPQDAFAAVDPGVKALVGVYGVYDMRAMWTSYQVQAPRNNIVEKFLGAAPMENPQLYFDASATELCDIRQQRDRRSLGHRHRGRVWSTTKNTPVPFQLALKQAGFFVRPCIVHGAPHYWMNDPIDEPGSYSGFLAPRLIALSCREAVAQATIAIASKLLDRPAYFFSNSRVPSLRTSGWIAAATFAKSQGR